MTRQEAIAYMLSTHKPIAHKLFGKEEFVRYDGMDLKDESNLCLPYGEFGLFAVEVYGKMVGLKYNSYGTREI